MKDCNTCYYHYDGICELFNAPIEELDVDECSEYTEEED